MKYKDDPVIKRIRDARHKISAKFGHDPEKLVDHYIELQKQYADRLRQRVGKAESTETQQK